MDLSTVIGLGVAFGAIIFAIIFGHTDAMMFVRNWDAIVLVFGGTFGATMIGFPMKVFLGGMRSGFQTAFRAPLQHERNVISTLVSFAEKARREGLLVLESEAAELKDDFMRRGIQLVIDGRDTDIIRKILETEVTFVAERNAKAEQIFTAMGGFSPTLGIIGTVVGLMKMLSGLGDLGGADGGNPAAKMGEATASAFVATFFGIMFANLLWLPIATKIKERNGQLLLMREIMIEGILAIQAGDNPRLLEEKLLAFIDPKDRESEVEEGGAIAGEAGYSASSA